jgi:hypothetical protein
MKANKHLLFAVGLLLISLVSRNSIAQNGYYFLTNQGLTIWKEPYKGWKEVADATLDSSALNSLSISEGIGMVAFKSNNGPSFLVSSFEHGDCKIYAEVFLPHNGKAGLLLQGRYEIILADSALISDSLPNLSTIGAIAPRKRVDSLVDGKVPRKNAYSKRGRWQTIEVFFKAPRFGERGIKTSYAKVWVKVNGVTVQNGVELVNSTFGGHNKAERLTGPLVFAGKQSDVAFRNVTLKRLKIKNDYHPY